MKPQMVRLRPKDDKIPSSQNISTLKKWSYLQCLRNKLPVVWTILFKMEWYLFNSRSILLLYLFNICKGTTLRFCTHCLWFYVCFMASGVWHYNLYLISFLYTKALLLPGEIHIRKDIWIGEQQFRVMFRNYVYILMYICI